MSLQEKYQTLLELANANGTTYELAEGDGVAIVPCRARPTACCPHGCRDSRALACDLLR